MGLEQFIDGLEAPDEEDSSSTDEVGLDLTYSGDNSLVDVPWGSVENTLEGMEYSFKRFDPIEGSDGMRMLSNNKEFALAVLYPEERHDWDCLLVKIIDQETLYDVIEPHPVYFTPEWQDQLKKTVSSVIEKQDELVYCNRCGSVMIIRDTNTGRKRIRGCSNYPDCMNKQVLERVDE